MMKRVFSNNLLIYNLVTEKKFKLKNEFRENLIW